MCKSPSMLDRNETGMQDGTQGVYLDLLVRLDMATGCVKWSRIPAEGVQLFRIVFSIQGT